MNEESKRVVGVHKSERAARRAELEAAVTWTEEQATLRGLPAIKLTASLLEERLSATYHPKYSSTNPEARRGHMVFVLVNRRLSHEGLDWPSRIEFVPYGELR